VRFRDIQHQDAALSILRRALRSGRAPHAYLFDGPDGVGKERAARALATRLLCESTAIAPDSDACDTCPACRLMAAGNHPDFHLIERGLHKLHPDRSIRASKGLFLSVAIVRHFLIEPAGGAPALGRRRVFVVRDAERMNEEAQNALLKTLEEPPGSACLILVTASAGRLLPTIRSRCPTVPFRLLPREFVEAELVRVGAEKSAARALATMADGRLGAALRWLRADLLGALPAIEEALHRRLPGGDVEGFGKGLVETAEALAARLPHRGDAALAEEETEEPETESDDRAAASEDSARAVATDELREALKLVLMLIANVSREQLLHAAAGVDSVRKLAAGLTAGASPPPAARTNEELEEAVRATARAEWMLDRNVAPQLVCERLGIAILDGDAAATPG
jgi:DNA polymerase-3 subunit delta'